MTSSCMIVGTPPLWSLLAVQELNRCIEQVQGQKRNAGPACGMSDPGDRPVSQRHDDGSTHQASADGRHGMYRSHMGVDRSRKVGEVIDGQNHA